MRQPSKKVKEETKVRGVFEHPKGSKVYWIHYYDQDGKRHREKVGSKSAAIDLYRQRKSDVRRDVKLPPLRNTRAVSISDLIDDVLEFTAHHKDKRSYISKAGIVREALGSQAASTLTPQELERWLRQQCKTPATSNRYKAFISLCYREGLKNGKVQTNPARLIQQRKENNARLRFLSHEEYKRLHAIIAEKWAEHVSEFVVSVHTGMRLGEQFSTTWGQVHLDRRTIELTDTKNGSHRTVALNTTAHDVLASLKQGMKPKTTDPVFPTTYADYSQREWFPAALEAAGIADYTWHSNRHTFCSWLAQAGVSIKEIQELAGHKTISMSARYAHLAPAHKLAAVERISNLQQPSEQPPKKTAT
jgi:integrase